MEEYPRTGVREFIQEGAAGGVGYRPRPPRSTLGWGWFGKGFPMTEGMFCPEK